MREKIKEILQQVETAVVARTVTSPWKPPCHWPTIL